MTLQAKLEETQNRISDLEKEVEEYKLERDLRRKRIALGQVAYRTEEKIVDIVLPKRRDSERRRVTINDIKSNRAKLTEEERQEWDQLRKKILNNRWEGNIDYFVRTIKNSKDTRFVDAHGGPEAMISKKELISYALEQYKNNDSYYREDAINLIEVLSEVSNNKNYPLI
ncbi:hypothetical protein AKO1_001778 [Acrasis kona]|uniref:Uncharacterized protein n=1 Tax=Acrasis kona TaxID=1008807 RepID=A0AAW2Z9X1_9EUKA